MSGKKQKPFLFRWRDALCASDLRSTAKFVAGFLSFHMDMEGGSAYPGLILLARETSSDERTVRTALDELVERGWLRRTRRWHKPDLYEALIPAVWTERPVKERAHVPPIAGSQVESGDVPEWAQDPDLLFTSVNTHEEIVGTGALEERPPDDDLLEQEPADEQTRFACTWERWIRTVGREFPSEASVREELEQAARRLHKRPVGEPHSIPPETIESLVELWREARAARESEAA